MIGLHAPRIPEPTIAPDVVEALDDELAATAVEAHYERIDIDQVVELPSDAFGTLQYTSASIPTPAMKRRATWLHI